MTTEHRLPYISRTLAYTAHDGTVLKSRLCLPQHAVSGLSAVLIFPEWWGMSEHAKHSAERLAQAGYAAMTVDLYGEALLTDDASIANENRNALLADPLTLIERTNLALQAVKNLPEVNENRIAAIGFCFGGKVALDMARRGADLKAVCSFHGNLTPAIPAMPGMVKAQVLVQHGGQDSMVSMESLDAFREEMDAAGAIYQIDVFPDAKHGFTNPQATANGEKNGIDLAYNETAAIKAWQNMLDWLAKNI